MEGSKIVLSIEILQKCMKYLVTDSQKSLLLTGIVDFTKGEETKSTGDSLVDFALDMITTDIGEQDKRFSEKRSQNRMNAQKRWNKPASEDIRLNANECDGMQSHANACKRIDSHEVASARNANINIKEKEKEEEIKEINKEKKETHPADGSASALNQIILSKTDNPVLQDSLKEFCRMRTKIKKPLTNRALTLAIDKLLNMSTSSEQLVGIVNQSVEHCWQSFYPLSNGNGTQGNFRKTEDRSYAQRTNEENGADAFPEWLKGRIIETESI